jgi:peptidylprolyl isomerase
MVRIRYAIRLANGACYDNAEDWTSLQFTAGSNELTSALSLAVLGMRVGEKKSITVPPEQGFGLHEAGLVQRVPRTSLPHGTKVGGRLSARVGDRLNVSGREGRRRISIWVTELGEGSATVDANHPLAGQTLTFELEVSSIQPRKGADGQKAVGRQSALVVHHGESEEAV